MKFEMTRCSQCGSEMLMGASTCPSCGRPQSGAGRPGPYQPGTLLAVVLAAVVLLFFSWMKPPAPQVSQITSPASATFPSR
jgi:zinc-ribbon domain